jgi:cation diffusion facilitator family transporter
MASSSKNEISITMETSPVHKFGHGLNPAGAHESIHDLHLLHGDATSSAVLPEHGGDSRQRTMSTFDTEDQTFYNKKTDPLDLARKRIDLDNITANTTRKRDNKYNPLTLAGKTHAAKITKFYEKQNENIDLFLRPVDEHVRLAKQDHESEALRVKIAVNASFAANICLAILQVYGAVASGGSLSLFTTMADAIFDPLSNLTLILANKAIQKVDARTYPAGKSRIETAANIAFCFMMTAVSFLLLVLSSMELGNGSDTKTKPFHLPSIIAVSTAFAVKFGLFLYCWALRNKYSQIRILWEDHRNDLFINGAGLCTSALGSKVRWWIDPMGAMLLSLLIATLWLHTSYEEFQKLIGKAADTEVQQLITYVSMMHSPQIRQIDTVRAWHSGPRLVVEVDVVMDPESTLRSTHDVAEELQMKLESLPDVERAYVHVDYETTHKPEHFLKKEM